MEKRISTVRGLLIIALFSITIFSCSDDDSEGPDSGALSISTIAPLTAREGDVVTITGTGFSTAPSENSVLFNKTKIAKVVSATVTELKVEVPAEAPTGPIEVKVGGVSQISSQVFTLDASQGAPAITAVDPTHGLPGNEITLTGRNFVEGAVVAEVFFGTEKATIVSSTATSLRVSVPAGLDAGEVKIKAVRATNTSNEVTFVVDELPKTVKATYWTSVNGIYKGIIAETGVEIVKLYGEDNNVFGSFGIAFNPVDNKVYFKGESAEGYGVLRAPANGSGPVEVLFTDDSYAAGDLALDPENNAVYFLTAGSGKTVRIMKANYDALGTAPVALYEVATGGVNSIKLSVANGKLYWTEYAAKRVMEGSLDGTAAANVLFDGGDNLAGPYNLAVDADDQKIFVVENTDPGATATDAIYTGTLDGSGALTKIVSAGADLNDASDVEVDSENNYVLWITSQTGEYSVKRAGYDGATVETLFSGPELTAAAYFDIEVGTVEAE